MAFSPKSAWSDYKSRHIFRIFDIHTRISLMMKAALVLCLIVLLGTMATSVKQFIYLLYL